MELRHMRYFAAVARQRSFTQAARLLHISQPSLSQQMQQLEHELGVTLLRRTKRSVQLTPAGEAFLQHAEHILRAVDQAQHAMQDYRHGLAGTVTVGMITTLDVVPMPRLLRCFRQHHPQVRVTLREGTTHSVARWLRGGEVESILICSMAGCTPDILADPLFAAEEVLREELGILVAPTHPLAERAEVVWEDLRGLPLVAMNPGSGLHGALMQLSRDAGFAPVIAYESSDIDTICALTAEGLGAALVPRSVAENRSGALRWLRFAAPAPLRVIHFVWPQAGRSPAANAWIDFFRAHASVAQTFASGVDGPPCTEEREG